MAKPVLSRTLAEYRMRDGDSFVSIKDHQTDAREIEERLGRFI